MKYGARSLLLLTLLAACVPGSPSDADHAAHAARADSSAAGYDVGPLVVASSRHTADSASKAATTAGNPDPAERGGRSTGTPVPMPVDSAKRARTTVDSGTARVITGRGGSRSSTGPTLATGADSARRGGTALPPLDPALEPDFITYDTTRKSVTFQLAAGDEIPEQVSFNGAQRGGRTLTVPHGWRVTLAFANRDPQLPHSVTIVDVAGLVPEQVPGPVFPGAQTVRVEEGLLEGDADEITFAADRVGRYLIACGVLGHAQRGQWITLDVSTTVARPSYR